MNDYLTKPMQRDEGIEVLRKFLRVDRFSPTENEESASVETDVATVDTETLAALRSQIGDANLQTVIGKFQQEARQRWSALANAEDHQDRAREAHTLASTCSSFGLPPAAEALRKIEERAKQSTPEDAERLAEVGALLELSLVELEATLSRL